MSVVTSDVMDDALRVVYQPTEGLVVANVSLADFSVKSRKPFAIPGVKPPTAA